MSSLCFFKRNDSKEEHYALYFNFRYPLFPPFFVVIVVVFVREGCFAATGRSGRFLVGCDDVISDDSFF